MAGRLVSNFLDFVVNKTIQAGGRSYVCEFSSLKKEDFINK